MNFQTLASTLFTAVFVIPYLFVFVFSPGFMLSRPLKRNRLETLTFALVLGFSLYSLIVYLIRYINLPFFLAELLLIGIIFLAQKQNKRKKTTKKKKFQLSFQQKVLIPLALLVALIHAAVLIQSGTIHSDGREFVELSFHDSMQHFALIKRAYQTSHFPHPSYAGAEMKNYHYLIDTSLAGITRFSFVDLYNTYYRIYPLAISLIFSVSLFTFTRSLTKNEAVSNLAIILTVFGGNASFFASYFRGDEYSWGSNAFMINPIVDILQNPASIFVLAQMLSVFLLLKMYSDTKKKKAVHLNLFLIMGIIAGTMITFKAWGGLLILTSLGAAAGWQLITRRDPRLFASVLFAGSITAILFLPGYDSATSASPVWAPGWLLRSMLNDADRWNVIPELYQEETFIFLDQKLKLIKLYTKWVLIYFLGNFWLRSLGFITVILLLRKHIRLTAYHAALGSMLILSFVLPLLFFQGRMAYDIEQFAPYAIVLASIYTLVALQILIRQQKQLGWFIAIGLTVLSLPSNYTSLSARIFSDKKVMTHDEIQMYQAITAETQPSDVIMLYISHRNVATLEFPAMTVRDAFYAGRTLSIITGEDHETRRKQLERFFKFMSPHERVEYLREHDLHYLYLHQEDKSDYIPDESLAEEVVSINDHSLYRFTY